ncbi:PD40 domain-containing protein [Streptomyces sp. WM6386]|uniref:PD40 domain-containing protein n=1 Tax=Streptomyces sp. WM6386 TaxID=1415558 RepID=UPI000695AD7D|nr:PD40 domain-containing protein [Streptomyces sp. WM6386]
MSSVSLGTALLLALTGTTAGAELHAPRVHRVSTATDASQADGESTGAAISADGRKVAFTSIAPSFGCARFDRCLLVKDLDDGGVTKIDLGSGYTYGSPAPSADGSRIAFSAGTRFLAPYLYDSATGRAEKLWPQDPPGFNELGRVQSISPDGTHVAYTIGNRNGDANFRLLYVRDTATGTDGLISPAEEGDKPGASVSGDGEKVVYSVRGDVEAEDPADLFVKDRATGGRTQVGYIAFEQGGEVHVRDLDTGALSTLGAGSAPSISADGRKVAFQQGGEVRVRDLDTATTTRIRGSQPSLSGNGTHVAYTSRGAVYLRELATGKRQLISVDRWGGRNDLSARHPSINADGTVVAFESASPDLVEGDTNGVSDVFLRTVQ